MVPFFGMCAGLQRRRQGPCMLSKVHATRLQSVARLICFLAWSILGSLATFCRAQSNSSGTPQAATPSDAAIERAQQLVIEGKLLVDAGDLEQGEKFLRDALAAYDAIPNANAQGLFGQANCYMLLGSVASQQSDDDKAIQLLRKAYNLYGVLKGEDVDNNRIAALVEMAKIYERRKQTAETLEIVRRIAEIRERLVNNDAELARTKSNIGVLLTRLGRLHEAAEILKDAVTLSQRSNAPPEMQADCLRNLGSTEVDLREPASAEEHFRQALALLDPVEHTEGSRAMIKVSLSDALLGEKRPEEARQELEEALRLVSGLAEFREIRIRALTALARDTDERLHRKDDAMKLYREVLAQSEGLEGSEDVQLLCLNNLGNDLHHAGKTGEATEMFRKAIAIIDHKPNNVSHDFVALVRQSYGHLLLDAGNTSEALTHLLSALRVKWSWLGGDLEAMTRTQKQVKIDELFPLADLSYTVALKSPNDLAPRAYEVLLLTKALHSEATRAEQESLLYSGTPETSTYRGRYIELRKQLSRRALDSTHTEVPESNEGLAKLASEANNLELDLRRRARTLQQGIQLKPVAVDQVRSRLRPGEVLLDYFIYSEVDPKTQAEKISRYGVFRLDGTSGKVEMADLGEEQSVVRAVEAVRDCEKTQADPTKPSLDEEQLAKLSDQLRQLILDPILPSTINVKRIYVAPDGLLGLIPFDALPTAKTPSGWRYLAEDVEVVYLLTGRELVRSSSRQSSGTEVWLFGDPDFDSTPEQRLAAFNNPSPISAGGRLNKISKRNLKPVLMGAEHPSGANEKAVPTDWQPLKGTRSLVKAVAEEASKGGAKTKILLGAEASEEVLSRIRAPRMLMFATHGYFLRRMTIAHVTIDFFGGGFNEDFWETANPLQRSMLVLAGANRRTHHVVGYVVGDEWITAEEAANRGLSKEELSLLQREVSDGLLTAYEIPGVDLEDTELVILAGCESGLGVTSEESFPGIRQALGESVAGLRQAFTIAGARSVVTSLWEVPLDQTVEQIQGFVSGWLSRGLPRYRAFHESQLKALQTARRMNLGGHPFWWAGFVYFGDPGDR